MFGTTAAGKGFFGGGNMQWIPRNPVKPDLDFFNTHSWLGVPFYHFSADWNIDTHSKINFEKAGDYLSQGPQVLNPPMEAKVGDRVRKWSNIWLSPGEGDAVVETGFQAVHSMFSPGNHTYFGEDSFPTLVARHYNDGKQVFKGLQFTGTEFLSILGSTVVDAYSPPDPLFSTGGTSWAGNTGATFIMVIDQDPWEPDPGFNPWNPVWTSQTQALLYSRYPSNYDTDPLAAEFWENSTSLPGEWPQSEDMGVQYFRNVRHNAETIQDTFQAFGPNGTTLGSDTSYDVTQIFGGTFTAPRVACHLSRAPEEFYLFPTGNIGQDQYGGSEFRVVEGGHQAGTWYPDFDAPGSIYGLKSSPEFEITGPLSVGRAHQGFQVILLEYDNVNQITHEPCGLVSTPPCPPEHSEYRQNLERYYTGPSMKIYGMSNPFMPSWRGLDLTYPKFWDEHPALNEHTLFSEETLQVGGTHPFGVVNQHSTPGVDHAPVSTQKGNGFRGVIFELLFLEGTLSASDKGILQEYFLKKYTGAL